MTLECTPYGDRGLVQPSGWPSLQPDTDEVSFSVTSYILGIYPRVTAQVAQKLPESNT